MLTWTDTRHSLMRGPTSLAPRVRVERQSSGRNPPARLGNAECRHGRDLDERVRSTPDPLGRVEADGTRGYTAECTHEHAKIGRTGPGHRYRIPSSPRPGNASRLATPSLTRRRNARAGRRDWRTALACATPGCGPRQEIPEPADQSRDIARPARAPQRESQALACSHLPGIMIRKFERSTNLRLSTRPQTIAAGEVSHQKVRGVSLRRYGERR